MVVARAAARRTPRSAARRWRRRGRGNNDDGTADSPIGGEEMAPTKKGANEGKENSPRNSAVKNLSLRGRGPPAEPGGLIGTTSWLRRWGSLGVHHAQQRGDGARVYGRQDRCRKLPAQQPGKNSLTSCHSAVTSKPPSSALSTLN